MLSTHEEHAMYFANHSLKEFREVYEQRVISGKKTLKVLLSTNYVDIFQIKHLSDKIKNDESRLVELDQRLAYFCDVKFIDVSKQLKDQGHF